MYNLRPIRPRHFEDEQIDFRMMTSADSDTRIVKLFKFFLRLLFGSVRKTILHSRVLRRYLSLKSLPTQKGTLIIFLRMIDNDDSVVEVIETTDGVMISTIDTQKVGRRLNTVTSRWLKKRGRFIENDPETGLYKKLFRLKFVYNHLDEVYADKYNIYQAAYVDAEYTVRAVLCFMMQIISFTALIEDGEQDGATSLTAHRRSPVDVTLIIVTIMYIFFNLPANSITSSMSHNVVLFVLFLKTRMYNRLVFVLMDLFVNSFIMCVMPLVSARLLYNTVDSASIVTTSLSVFFVTSLDDSAITKSESNNMTGSQSALLRELTEKVDSFVDYDGMWIVAYLPWFEILLLMSSVVASYSLLL